MAILTLCPPHIVCRIVPSTTQKSPHVHARQLCTFVLMQGGKVVSLGCKVTNLTSHGHSHLVSTLCCVSSCPLHHTIVTLCEHSHLTWPFSSHIHMPPPCENNIFHLAWKNSQNSRETTPIPSIRYLLRATNNVKNHIDYNK